MRGIEVHAHHGVFDFERRDGQKFLIDLRLGLDTRSAAGGDDLSRTVDYGVLVDEVKAAAESDPVDLIETLAQRIADVCLGHQQVEWVEVTVHKPHAPIAATVRRRRPDDQPEPHVTQSPNPNVIDTDTLTGEMHPIRRAVLSIGSNLGDRVAYLQGAVDSLTDTPEVWVTGVSPVYETRPVDAPEGSEDFLNVVVTLDTTLSAATLLDRALAIETAYERERGEPNGPRTLDVDLIVVGDRRADDDHLVLPHPRAAERSFVLAPWFDLEPDAELPGHGAIADLMEKLGRDGLTRRDDIELEMQ